MDLKTLRTDAQASEDGVWIEVGDGASLLVARMNNKRYARKLQSLLKPFQRQVEMGTLGENKAEDMLADAYAHGILLDWKGLKLDGKALKYSVGKAKELLLDPTLKDFKQLVEDIANSQENYREQELEAAEKN